MLRLSHLLGSSVAHQRFRAVQSGAEWRRVAQSGAEWCRAVQSGSEWCRVVQSGAGRISPARARCASAPSAPPCPPPASRAVVLRASAAGDRKQTLPALPPSPAPQILTELDCKANEDGLLRIQVGRAERLPPSVSAASISSVPAAGPVLPVGRLMVGALPSWGGPPSRGAYCAFARQRAALRLSPPPPPPP
eukprot:SAG11_NODE_6737_length_1257_cov_1.307427_2_plen_191_part_01